MEASQEGCGVEPNCYLFDDIGVVHSVRINLKNVAYGLKRDTLNIPLPHAERYEYWTHLERFWKWFKKFHRGGWIDKEKQLKGVVEEVTYRHYRRMSSEEIETEVKTTLYPFLFERENLTQAEKKKLERFASYIDSLEIALS